MSDEMNVYERNALGGYQVAIPEPLFVGFRLRKFRCCCKGWGKESPTFKKRIDYENHYFREHILKGGTP